MYKKTSEGKFRPGVSALGIFDVPSISYRIFWRPASAFGARLSAVSNSRAGLGIAFYLHAESRLYDPSKSAGPLPTDWLAGRS